MQDVITHTQLNLAPKEPGIYTIDSSKAPTLSPEQASFVLQNLATSLFQQQSVIDTPSLITNADGKLLCLTIGDGNLRNDPLETTANFGMRAVAAAMKSPDLCKSGVAVHLLSGSKDSIPGLADIFNFAPSTLYVTEQPQLQFASKSNSSILAPTFWGEASEKRKVELKVVHRAVDPGKFELASTFEHRQVVLPTFDCPEYLIPHRQKWLDAIFINPMTCPVEAFRPLMKDLHTIARQNVDSGGGPFSAAVIDRAGRLIGLGANRVVPTSDATAHGERVAIWDAIARCNGNISAINGSLLITSAYTCVGCAAGSISYGVRRIVFGNTREQVEKLTPFTEGPLNRAAFAPALREIAHLQTGDRDSLAAFRRFAEIIKFDPSKSYLKDES